MMCDQTDDVVPSFGTTGDFGNAGVVTSPVASGQGVPALGERSGAAPTVVTGDDELSCAASVDKVMDMTEQMNEFLVNFTTLEQKSILAPFLQGDDALRSGEVEPHIDEARRFIWNYLAIYSDCERDLILEKWRPSMDSMSVSSATGSLTPSVTPPGSVTPVAVTPREFLSKRREVNETYHSHSPFAEHERH
eukprot:TRINITY_DN8780_c1_g1_i1.p1 TRINITY_DN8780_c1_g1~~TRINITY_DN8780_c1_g1_i1.p1  ORF type:complete len:192 (-),score=37.32 TRINITY_DN8780_c1_g1_i1:46-621(-)